MFSANSSQVSDDKLFVEDVFSTYLYTGTGAAQTITNGIDLAGKGGLVWAKARSAAQGHILADTVRGLPSYLQSNSTSGAATFAQVLTSFNSNGFSLGTDNTINGSGNTVASWTFREAPKFFDVVTWTGDGALTRDIAHNLGSRPHCVIIKRTDTSANWKVGFRDAALNGYILQLNTTDAANTATTYAGGSGYGIASGASVNTHFRVEEYGGSVSAVNASGGTYVAYLWADDAASTGLIRCGSFTSNASNVVANVTLGWEPQWVMVKRTDSTSNWVIYDNMRGMPISGYARTLNPNLTSAEALDVTLEPNATGFSSSYFSATNATYIYIAIRRGPMRTPTLGTSVFAPVAFGTGTAANTKVTTNFPVDFVINTIRSGDGKEALTRLTASNTSASSIGLRTNTTDAETNRSPSRGYGWDSNVSLTLGGYYTDFGGSSNIQWNFRRAPGFMDVVCYTGTGSARTVNHNLGVAPELMIVKQRNAAVNWIVYTAPTGATKFMYLDLTTAAITYNIWNNTAPTSTVFSVGTDPAVNGSGGTYVAYLFASAPGVSKVGSYTGNGSSQTINCAFAAGARFVMIKRTDSTGDWYVWDTARGIVAGNDPHLSLNTAVAEVTTDDTIDTDSSGFVVNQVAATNVNVSSATYIYLAIA